MKKSVWAVGLKESDYRSCPECKGRTVQAIENGYQVDGVREKKKPLREKAPWMYWKNMDFVPITICRASSFTKIESLPTLATIWLVKTEK